MDKSWFLQCLTAVAEGKITPEQAFQQIGDWPYQDLGFAKIDLERRLRNGSSEVIFCPGKTPQQVVEIFKVLNQKSENIIATRASEVIYQAVRKELPEAEYHDIPKIITVWRNRSFTNGKVGVISAGTADMGVAEEAALTAEIMGSAVERIYDVGVAGIHRLFDNRERMKECRVLIAVAGMEGALASVIGGLMAQPLIAVPTSIGYGANFQGLAALLTMLNSCASGIGVVNIDNGFGAGMLAHRINILGEK